MNRSGTLALLVILGVCGPVSAYERTASPAISAQARGVFRQAEVDVKAGDLQSAISRYRLFVKLQPDGEVNLLGRLRIADLYLQLGNFGVARQEYMDIYRRFPVSDKRSEIFVGLAYAEYQLRRYKQTDGLLARVSEAELRRIDQVTRNAGIKRWLSRRLAGAEDPSPNADSSAASAESHSTKDRVSLLLLPSFNTLSVDTTARSNGAKADFVSTVSPAILVELDVPFSARIDGIASVGGRDVSIQPPDGWTLSDSPQFDFEFGFGIKLFPLDNRRLAFAAKVGMSEEFFFRSLSATALSLDNVLMPRTDLDVSWDFVTFGQMALTLDTGAAYLFSASTDTEAVTNGYEVFGKLIGTLHTEPGIDPRAAFEVLYQSITSTIEIRQETLLGLELGVSFRL